MSLGTTDSKNSTLLQTLFSWFDKLRQQPDIYPIKYYKKDQFRRMPARVPVKSI